MTIKEFAEERWVNIPANVLKHAGINCINSYRCINGKNCDPPKKQELDYQVFDYPESFMPRMELIFKRLIKSQYFKPEVKQKPVDGKETPRRERRRFVKPVYTVNASK